MARYIRFDFNDEYPIIIRVEQDLTDAEYATIEDALQSYIDHVDNQWDANDQFIDDIMNSFNYDWDFVTFDKTIYV
jgi:hypothetical protein